MKIDMPEAGRRTKRAELFFHPLLVNSARDVKAFFSSRLGKDSHT